MSRSSPYRETPPLHMRPPKPVTLAALAFPVDDPEADAAEAAEARERAAVTRTIRQGRDAWERLGDANSFLGWSRIAAALHCGKLYSLRASGVRQAWGATYSRVFNKWMNAHGFGAMRPSDRSHAITLHENLTAIEQWRAALPDKRRRRLRSAQANVKTWLKESKQAAALNGSAHAAPQPDNAAKALALWRQFTTAMRLLSPSESGPLWGAVAAEAARHA